MSKTNNIILPWLSMARYVMGGLPPGSLTLIGGPAKSGRTRVCQRIVAHAFSESEQAIQVSSNIEESHWSYGRSTLDMLAVGRRTGGCLFFGDLQVGLAPHPDLHVYKLLPNSGDIPIWKDLLTQLEDLKDLAMKCDTAVIVDYQTHRKRADKNALYAMPFEPIMCDYVFFLDRPVKDGENHLLTEVTPYLLRDFPEREPYKPFYVNLDTMEEENYEPIHDTRRDTPSSR